MRAIKNIIFDLGGVLLGIDFDATMHAFERLGVNNFPLLFSQHHADDLFEKLETGVVSPAVFYRQFRELVGIPLSDTAIESAWNAMLLHFSPEKMHWLDSLKVNYNLYLFSNTNQIHYDHFSKTCRQENNGRTLESYFIHAWYSHELGLRKPYSSSFTAILEKGRLLPEETVFIDDTIGNIEGAKAAGLQAIHLKAPQTVLDLGL